MTMSGGRLCLPPDMYNRQPSMQFRAWGPSLKLYSLFGITVKLHWTYVVPVLIILSITWKAGAPERGAALIGALTAIILLHEYGHALTARKLGVGADEIMFGATGGLAVCGEGRTAMEDVLIAFAGPLVNILLIGALLVPLALLEIPIQADLFIPLADWSDHFWVWLFKLNLILTAFNLLLPLYPLDGGRIFTGILAARLGKRRALMISTTLALLLAVGLIGVALWLKSLLLAIVSFYLLWEASRMRRFAKWGMIPEYSESADMPVAEEPEVWQTAEKSEKNRPGFFERWRLNRREKRRQREEETREQLKRRVDSILEKVSRDGMGSLTPQERRTLEEASRKMRGE